jgi:hypothetical protein
MQYDSTLWNFGACMLAKSYQCTQALSNGFETKPHPKEFREAIAVTLGSALP